MAIKSPAARLRFFFYSHDGLGLGHTRRNLAVAAALADLAPQASILLATGIDDVSQLGVHPKIEVLKLPGLRKVANERYAARRLHIPATDNLTLRSTLLTAAVQSFRPTVMLVDKHPLGAKGELRLALKVLKESGGRAALGLRDILDDRAAILREWASYDLHTRIAELYDLVLVYGERAVFNLIDEYDLPASVAIRTRFCGFAINESSTIERANNRPPFTCAEGLSCSLTIRGTDNWRPPFIIQPRSRPIVLATPGGGEDGSTLLKAFIRAASGAPWDGIVVTGPMFPEKAYQIFRRLAAEAGVTLHFFVPDLAESFQQVDALVCMGGYNTLAEALSRGTPTVCVPRTSPRSEQLIRARAFARLGLLRVVEPDQLNTDSLRREVTAALELSRQELRDRANAALDFNGAQRAAGHLIELAETLKSRVAVGSARWGA